MWGQTGTGWLSGTTSATDRNVIVGRIRTHLEIALDPMKTVDQARSALIGAKAECAIYEISVPTVAATPKK